MIKHRLLNDILLDGSNDGTVEAYKSRMRTSLGLPRVVYGTGLSTADATTAVTSAETTPPYYVPPGTFTTTIAQGSFVGRWYGDGTIVDISGNKRGRMFAAINAAPSSLGTHSSILTAFNGDTSKVQVLVEHRITGTATLGQPSSGYTYTPEAYPHYTYLFNTSGWNDSTSTNTGRTAAVAYRASVYQAGQGDCVAFNASAFVSGARSGATSFLANPAGSLFNGNINAGQAGVYLNPFEIALNDGGFDVAGVGIVINMTRGVLTGALGTSWNGVRTQSIGSQKIDSHFMAYGNGRVGLDLSHGTYDMPIALAADMPIYMNVTPDSNTFKRYPTKTNYWIDYDSSSARFRFVDNNLPVLTLKSASIFAYYQLRPAVDNTTLLGDAAVRWAQVHGVQFRLGPSSGVIIQSGNGTPEAAVTAPVGSMWLRSDGGAATTLYIKETGTGNTGWVAK